MNEDILIVSSDKGVIPRIQKFVDIVGRTCQSKILIISLEEYDHGLDHPDFFIFDDLYNLPVKSLDDTKITSSDFKFRKKQYWQKGRW